MGSRYVHGIEHDADCDGNCLSFHCHACKENLGLCMAWTDQVCVVCVSSPAGQAVMHHVGGCAHRRAAMHHEAGADMCRHLLTYEGCPECRVCTCQLRREGIDFAALAELEELLA